MLHRLPNNLVYLGYKSITILLYNAFNPNCPVIASAKINILGKQFAISGVGRIIPFKGRYAAYCCGTKQLVLSAFAKDAVDPVAKVRQAW